MPRPDPAPPSRLRRLAILLLAAGFGGASAAQVGVPGAIGTAAAQTTPQTAPPAAAARPAAPAEAPLSQAELEQMLAPVALYPDSLLMQVLMAATYPLEVVQAKRWLGQGDHARLAGEPLAQALVPQPWDPSVKSLVPFPDVLTLMNDQLEWTQALGDAVLAQQEDVLNAVQALRARAQATGTLQSGPQQVVTVTQSVTTAAPPAPGAAAPLVPPPAQIISIAPADPAIVYVPVYDPAVVYGAWPYPSYPPAYYPPPAGWGLGSALLTGMAFAGGVAAVGSLWGWARPGWGRGDVDIDVSRYNNINVNRQQISGNRWSHDVSHRHGVAYRNEEVANRYRGGDRVADRTQSREQFRGRADQVRTSGGGLDAARGSLADRRDGAVDRGPGDRGLGDRQGVGDRTPGDRPGLGDRTPGDRAGLADRTPGDRPGLGDRGSGDRPGLGDRAPGARPGAGDRAPGERPGLGDRPSGGGSALADRTPASRPAAGDRTPSGSRPAAGAAPRPSVAANGRPQVSPSRPQARPAAPQGLQGLGQGSDLRAAQQRGAASRASPVAANRGGAGVGQAAAARGGGQAAAARGGGRAAAAHGGGGGRAAAHGGGGRGGRQGR